MWLSGCRAPFKRIFHHKVEEFRPSIDVRLDLSISLKRAARLIAMTGDNRTPEHDGIGRQVEVLTSAHSQEASFERQLRVDPTDGRTSVRKEVLQRLQGFKKDNRFVNFRHRRVICGDAGPVVWFELIDAASGNRWHGRQATIRQPSVVATQPKALQATKAKERGLSPSFVMCLRFVVYELIDANPTTTSSLVLFRTSMLRRTCMRRPSPIFWCPATTRPNRTTTVRRLRRRRTHT